MAVGDETLRDANLATAIRDPLVGSVVGDYRIEGVLGTGAMGIVYRALHTVIGKPAAMKVLKPDVANDPDMVGRLVREARTVNAIRHPGIVDIFGFGNLPTGQPYIVMDLLEGEPLDGWIRREAPARPGAVYGLLDQLLAALAAAHHVGVIHRDLKPANIFLQKEGGRRVLKLLDFGLARQADRAGGSIRPTNPGTLLGTPAFMAPEQVMGEKVTPATDLYAVGGIAYQMLTNHLPHEAATAIDVLSQKMQFDPIRVRQWVPSLSEELDAWVMAMLAREEKDRPQSAEEVRQRLRGIAERGASGSHPPHAHTGAVPKRGWNEAKTVLLEGGAPAREESTGLVESPFSSGPVPARPPAQAPTEPGVPPPALSPPSPLPIAEAEGPSLATPLATPAVGSASLAAHSDAPSGMAEAAKDGRGLIIAAVFAGLLLIVAAVIAVVAYLRT